MVVVQCLAQTEAPACIDPAQGHTASSGAPGTQTPQAVDTQAVAAAAGEVGEMQQDAWLLLAAAAVACRAAAAAEAAAASAGAAPAALAAAAAAVGCGPGAAAAGLPAHSLGEGSTPVAPVHGRERGGRVGARGGCLRNKHACATGLIHLERIRPLRAAVWFASIDGETLSAHM
eukprot:scaffold139674_cov16-Tisochrysis_lutea.AAC.1